MRLRNKMAPSDNEHQLRFLVYTLERACDLADQSGNAMQVVVVVVASSTCNA